MKECMTINKMYDLNETIAKDLFKGVTYPWEILPKISEFIVKLGETLPSEEYDKVGDNVWIAKDAKVFDSAYINGPVIIDHGAEVRHCAFIRGNAIVGKGAVVGNSTELKNVILFDKVQVPHYNYVGDSVLGNGVHLGAGAICSNLKADKSDVAVKGDKVYKTGVRKFGAALADFADIGCGCVLNPGTVVGKNTSIYPLVSVRGVVPEGMIVKNAENSVVREVRKCAE